MTLQDTQLADEVIDRLNQLVREDPLIASDIAKLIQTRIGCSNATMNHPTLQTGVHSGEKTLGLLGLLNGVVGVIPEGPKKGWGYVAAEFADDGRLVRFLRTDSVPENEIS